MDRDIALRAALTALNTAEGWMLEAVEGCTAENATTCLPQGCYRAGLREVRSAIVKLRSAMADTEPTGIVFHR
jgi:hypothetical protein